MALIYQPSKRIFCGWFEPLKSTTYSEYPKSLKEQIGGNDEFESRMASLEQSLQTIISNEAMIANALAKLGNQTTPFA